MVCFLAGPDRPGALFRNPYPTSIKLIWTAPAGTYDGFKLSYEQNGELIEENLPSTSLIYEVKFLYPNTLYVFELVTLSGGVESEPRIGEFRTGMKQTSNVLIKHHFSSVM